MNCHASEIFFGGWPSDTEHRSSKTRYSPKIPNKNGVQCNPESGRSISLANCSADHQTMACPALKFGDWEQSSHNMSGAPVQTSGLSPSVAHIAATLWPVQPPLLRAETRKICRNHRPFTEMFLHSTDTDRYVSA